MRRWEVAEIYSGWVFGELIIGFLVNGVLLIIVPRLPILSSITIQGTFAWYLRYVSLRRALCRSDGASDGGDLWWPKEHEASDLRTLDGDYKHHILLCSQTLIFLIIGRLYRTTVQLSIYTYRRERYVSGPCLGSLSVLANDITESVQPL